VSYRIIHKKEEEEEEEQTTKLLARQVFGNNSIEPTASFFGLKMSPLLNYNKK